VLVQLVTAPGKLDVESFVAALDRFPEVRSIHRSVNDRPAEVTNLPTQLPHGDDAIEEELCGLRFLVGSKAYGRIFLDCPAFRVSVLGIFLRHRNETWPLQTFSTQSPRSR